MESVTYLGCNMLNVDVSDWQLQLFIVCLLSNCVS